MIQYILQLIQTTGDYVSGQAAHYAAGNINNGADMIRDKNIQVTTDTGTFQITITAEQIRQTVQRRMQSLMPKARILDMTETDADQGELLAKKRS